MHEPLLSIAKRVFCLRACADRKQVEAAKLLGIGERTLGGLMREYGVNRRTKVAADPQDVARLITFLGGTPPDETAAEVASLRIRHTEEIANIRKRHTSKVGELRQRHVADLRFLEQRCEQREAELLAQVAELEKRAGLPTRGPCLDRRPWQALTPYERQQRLEETYAR